MEKQLYRVYAYGVFTGERMVFTVEASKPSEATQKIYQDNSLPAVRIEDCRLASEPVPDAYLDALGGGRRPTNEDTKRGNRKRIARIEWEKLEKKAAPVSIKMLYIMAIFRHLEKQERYWMEADYWKATTARDFRLMSNDRRILAALLTLLISPVLLFDAIDLALTGKISRFEEAGS